MSHRNPPRLPQFSTRSRSDVEIILADTKRCGGGNSGDSAAAASRFVRNGLASLSFDSFLESYHLPSLWPLRDYGHAFELFTDGRNNAGRAVIGSGNGFVSPKMRRA
jgi:hypothetical protein